MSRYENYIMKNNVSSELYAPISSLATTIQVKSWQWARWWTDFPVLWTIEHIEDWKVKKREIIRITARSWDYLTVVRWVAPCPPDDDSNWQWITTFSFDSDDIIHLYITKEHFDQIKLALDDLMDNWNDRLYTTWTWWLNISVTEWNARVWTAEIYFAWWTATLTDNATNYVMLTGAWQITIDTTGRNTDFAKLALITTSWWEITNIVRWKMDTVGWVMSSKAWFRNVSNCVYNTRWELTQFVADSVTYNLTYESWAVKTVSFGQTTYTMTYSNGRLVWVVES